jgi:DNA-binding HxlR family transcriptional regulator/putative sterol carrier protein
MAPRTYGQYCGFARAVEVVGERWALLIIRDLLVGAKRFTDLQRGLPGIPSNILTARLKELEEAGIVQRRLLPRPEKGIAYELTPYGMELESTVYELGRWGAKSLAEPRAGETVTPDSLVMALRTTFRPEAARKSRLKYELRFGDIVLHARIQNGRLEAAQGPIENPDLIIETGPALKSLMAGEVTPAQALASGGARVTGDPKLLDRFVEMFHIGSMPDEKETA